MGKIQKESRDMIGVTIRTLSDVLKPSESAEAAKQAMQLTALHEGLCKKAVNSIFKSKIKGKGKTAPLQA
jgi:hypothetical protein